MTAAVSFALLALLALGGTTLLGRSVLWFFSHSLRGDLFRASLQRLLEAGKRETARKLCDAVPATSPYARVARGAVLELTLPARDPRARDPEDYRSAVEERPFEQRVREAMDPIVRDASAPVAKRAHLALVGCALADASRALGELSELLQPWVNRSGD